MSVVTGGLLPILNRLRFNATSGHNTLSSRTLVVSSLMANTLGVTDARSTSNRRMNNMAGFVCELTAVVGTPAVTAGNMSLDICSILGRLLGNFLGTHDAGRPLCNGGVVPSISNSGIGGPFRGLIRDDIVTNASSSTSGFNIVSDTVIGVIRFTNMFSDCPSAI